MARKTSAKGLINTHDAGSSVKRQLEVILQVLGGTKTVPQACEELAISESSFHRLREKALSGALEGLAPRPAGRPAKVDDTDPEVKALKDEIQELRIELQCSRVREELALVMPHVLQPAEDEKKTPRGAQEISVRRKGTSGG